MELAVFREKALPNQNNICQYGRRETKLVNMLHFINNQVWKLLFGRQADGIEQSISDENEYRIIDINPVTNQFIASSSGDSQVGGGHPNCSNFLAGIIEGILNASRMYCKCRAHLVAEEEEGHDNYSEDNSKQTKMQTLFIIQFRREVIQNQQINEANN